MHLRIGVDIEIQTQHIEMQPDWRTFIEERVGRLAERYPELLRVHVTLRHAAHHRHGVEEVAIVATYPGETLRASKEEERMRDAIHAALDGLERQLASRHEQRRRFGKAPGPRPSGTIARLFGDRGYGFIVTEDGEQVYFHQNALQELEFSALQPGFPVEMEIEEGQRGLQASRVFPAGERQTT